MARSRYGKGSWCVGSNGNTAQGLGLAGSLHPTRAGKLQSTTWLSRVLAAADYNSVKFEKQVESCWTLGAKREQATPEASVHPFWGHALDVVKSPSPELLQSMERHLLTHHVSIYLLVRIPEFTQTEPSVKVG